MPTIVSHAVVPVALWLGAGRKNVPGRLLTCGVAASILPDLDIVAFHIGVGYSDPFGHRGFSHSILFALILAIAACVAARWLLTSRSAAFLFVLVAGLSHGLLDMFTNGGMGVALWWPLSEVRLFAPWQVIDVSPLSPRRVIGLRGLLVLWSELKWVWAPSAVFAFFLALACRVLRRCGRPGLRHAVE